jgi:hypothetical protein
MAQSGSLINFTEMKKQKKAVSDAPYPQGFFGTEKAAKN